MPISPNYFAGSTAVFSASFTDENGQAIVPTAFRWTLISGTGHIVNDRKDVELPLAATVDIVLSGKDLTYEHQTLVIEGTYDSLLGTGLPLVQWIEFFVKLPPGVRY